MVGDCDGAGDDCDEEKWRETRAVLLVAVEFIRLILCEGDDEIADEAWSWEADREEEEKEEEEGQEDEEEEEDVSWVFVWGGSLVVDDM